MPDLPQPYLTAIRRTLPDVEPHDVDVLDGEGMVNDVVVVRAETVFRFPKDARARAIQQHEAQVLDAVRERVRVAVPNFEIVEDTHVVYRRIPGVPATRTFVLRLPESVRRDLLAGIVGFVRDLHAVPEEVLDAAAIGPSITERDLGWWEDFYADVRSHLFPHLMGYQRRVVEDTFEPVLDGIVPLAHDSVLVHGDLGPYHLLADPGSGRINGVIDFGTAGAGDPAVDVGVLLQVFGESLLAQAVEVYPEMRSWIDRARFLAVALELQWALAGVRHGDRELALAHLGGARDAMPVGAPF